MELVFYMGLISTFLITRFLTHKLHNKKNYNSNTLTGLIRRKSNFDFHHIHFGIIILFILLFLNFFFVINLILNYIFYAISLSLIADQLFPLLKIYDYFERKSIIVAIILHLIIIIIFKLNF